MQGQRISVVIPTLNEESTIAATLDDLSRRGPHEVIVVDGGSGDRTCALAAGLSSRLLVEEGGLARQLNRGAGEATGEVLLFHPADLRLPPAAFEAIREALEEPRVVGGAFSLGFDSPRAAFRVIGFFANLRNRLGFGPFGDQAIFARRESFEALGGFRPGAVLEDLDLVRRLRKRGRFEILKLAVRSSVRRWERDGLLRTTLSHLRVSAGYFLGKKRVPRDLKRWLQTRREEGPITRDPGG